MIAGIPVAILDPEYKDHTSGEADQRSGRSLGLSDLVDLSYQLYLIRCCDWMKQTIWNTCWIVKYYANMRC